MFEELWSSVLLRYAIFATIGYFGIRAWVAFTAYRRISEVLAIHQVYVSRALAIAMEATHPTASYYLNMTRVIIQVSEIQRGFYLKRPIGTRVDKKEWVRLIQREIDHHRASWMEKTGREAPVIVFAFDERPSSK